VKAQVTIRLTNGERVPAGTYETEAEAEERVRELMGAVAVPGSWPRVDNRYIRPDAIVSIDVNI
jgi:hypothetical protein